MFFKPNYEWNQNHGFDINEKNISIIISSSVLLGVNDMTVPYLI